MDTTSELARDERQQFADSHATGFIRAWMQSGVPVLVTHAGRYPAAALPDGRSTTTEPHVLVLIGGRSLLATGATAWEQSYTSVSVTAVGRRSAGRRRQIEVQRADETTMVATTDTAPWLDLAAPGIVAACERVWGIDAEFDAAEARIGAATAAYREPLDRPAYEAACAAEGVKRLTDDACDDYGVRFGDFGFPHYSAEHIVAMHLARRRRAAIVAARERAAQAPAADAAPRAWGAAGVRYDEACEACRRVTEVDNGSGRCQRCH